MKIRITMKAEAKEAGGGNFSADFAKAKAAVAAATRDRDNAQAALDLAQTRLNKMVEAQLQRYAA